MSNVLDETKQQQVIALGRLGWSLRRIESCEEPQVNEMRQFLWSALKGREPI